MRSIFKPNLLVDNINSIDFESLYNKGYRYILLDVDNTISPYYQELPNDNEKKIVDNLKKKGFEVIVFSNNTEKRVKKVADSLDCKYLSMALKPLPFGFIKARKNINVDLKKAICIGDQLLTDVLGANLIKVYSIYSKPIISEDSFITSINRKFERFIFKHILHEKV